jgi:hypothetical protein
MSRQCTHHRRRRNYAGKSGVHRWHQGPQPRRATTPGLCLHRADSFYCRLHPGSTKRTDAKPIFQPHPANDSATDRITAQTQWRSLRADACAREAASLVPQIDRISKTEAYQSLQGTPLGPLTHEDFSFPWWLFLANLGKNTQAVIGDGVVAAMLEDTWEDRVQLLLTRSDGTEARLHILQPPRGTCVVRLLPHLV